MARSTTLIFGDSGTFKTSNLGLAAHYIYRKTRGKQIRLVTAEQYRPIEPLIEAGVIDVFSVPRSTNPLVSLRKLSYGFWPNADGTKLVETSKDDLVDKVGAIFIEGLTSLSDLLMEDARDKQRQLGQTPVGKFTEEDEKFCNNPLDHYGFVQREMLARIRSFCNLPVEYIIFTAHEAKGEEEVSRSPIRGPGLTGTAATDKVAKEVGSLLHFDAYSESVPQSDPKTKQVTTIYRTTVRAFFITHPDPKVSGVLYKCKVRLPPQRIPELMKRWPGGYFEPTLDAGLDLFLEADDALAANTTGLAAEWKAKIDAELKQAQQVPQGEPITTTTK